LTLGLEALFIAIGLGIILGSYAAFKRGRWQDQSTMLLAVLGISVPSFILATILQYVFAMQFDWFPVARWGSFAQSVLPALSLAALPTAMIARLTRTSMVEVLQQDYILMAKSKGLGSFQIIFRHALRNALLPVVTYLGPLTANVLTGSFVVEKIFGIPGLGQWFVMSVANRDYTLIMSLTIFYSAFLMVCVFIVDVVYSLLDPRIKVAKI
jgi:oligopeptide transport system permease protein